MKTIVKTMTFGELASMYFPNLCDRHARRKLRNWIDLCHPLRKGLGDLSYDNTTRTLTPRMVMAILQFLGEP